MRTSGLLRTTLVIGVLILLVPINSSAQDNYKVATFENGQKMGYQIMDSTVDKMQHFRINLFAAYPTKSIAYAGIGYFNANCCMASASYGIKGNFSLEGSVFLKSFTSRKIINMSLKSETTGYNTMAFYTVDIPVIKKVYLAVHAGYFHRDALSTPSIGGLYDGSFTVNGKIVVNPTPLFSEIAIGGSLVRAEYAKVIRSDLSGDKKVKIVQYPKLLSLNLDVLVYPSTSHVLDTTNFREGGINPTTLNYSNVGLRLSLQGEDSWLTLGKNGDAGLLYLLAGEKNVVGWGYYGELGLYAAF